jgi:hypothetical protein
MARASIKTHSIKMITTCKTLNLDIPCKACTLPLLELSCFINVFNNVIKDLSTFDKIYKYYITAGDSKSCYTYRLTEHYPYFMKALELYYPNWFSRIEKLTILK